MRRDECLDAFIAISNLPRFESHFKNGFEVTDTLLHACSLPMMEEASNMARTAHLQHRKVQAPKPRYQPLGFAFLLCLFVSGWLKRSRKLAPFLLCSAGQFISWCTLRVKSSESKISSRLTAFIYTCVLCTHIRIHIGHMLYLQIHTQRDAARALWACVSRAIDHCESTVRRHVLPIVITLANGLCV